MELIPLDLADNTGLPEPPEHLSEAAQDLFHQYVAEFALLDPHVIAVLTVAMESFDRMREAQDILKEEGIITKDRFGKPKPHPATRIEAESRKDMLAALKQLNLGIIPPRSGVGRPSKGDAYLDGF